MPARFEVSLMLPLVLMILAKLGVNPPTSVDAPSVIAPPAVAVKFPAPDEIVVLVVADQVPAVVVPARAVILPPLLVI